MTSLRDEYEAGATIRKLATERGWSFNETRQALVDAGATIRKRGGARKGQAARAPLIAARLRAMEPSETFASIAAEFNVSRERVRQIAARLNISAAELARKRRQKTFAEIVTLFHDQGMGVCEIARHLGVCSTTVCKALDEAGISVAERIARGSEKTSRGLRAHYGTDKRSRQARALRKQGLSYKKIGGCMGVFPAHARQLVLYGGPDPLGRQREYLQRRRGEAQA